LQYFRVSRLKDMGDNGIRTTHNAPTEELLEACDRLGMLVMDENRLLGSDAETWGSWKTNPPRPQSSQRFHLVPRQRGADSANHRPRPASPPPCRTSGSRT
jgi:beta-galactosidase/beta-glucuronidase